MRRLHRSESNRVFTGVCGGVGEYFGIDPVLVRLVWVFATLMGGSGLVAYLVASIVIPSESAAREREASRDVGPGEAPEAARATTDASEGPAASKAGDFAGAGAAAGTTPVSVPGGFGEPSTAPADATESRGRARMFVGVLLLLAGLVWMSGSVGWLDWRFWRYPFWGELWSEWPGAFYALPAAVALLFVVAGIYLIFLYARQARDDLWDPQWIRRSRRDKKLAGVCGGLARHFGLDSTVVRLVCVCGTFFAPVTLFLYVVLALILPLDPESPAEGSVGGRPGETRT